MTTQAHYDNSSRTDDVVIGFNENLSLFKKNTRLNYCSSLTFYLCFIYPDLRELTGNKKISQTDTFDKALQEASGGDRSTNTIHG